MTETSDRPASVDYGYLEPTTVHFDDLDPMGIVHNSRYAIMLEHALDNFWTRQGYTYTNGKFSHADVFVAVAEFSISYKMPVRGTGTVGIHFWVDRLGESSVVYAYRVVSANSSTVHAEGKRVHIRLDPQTLRPTPWAADTNAIYEGLRIA